MKQLTSADFRKFYAREAEPVEVTAYGKVIGTWYPYGSELPAPVDASEQPPAAEAAPETPTRMTIRPVKGPVKQMHGVEKRILDPAEARKREREIYNQVASRLYGKKTGT